jgi:phosphoribosylanthranilate isomerase
MSVKVKICGITSPPDALAAVEAGADLIGFMFYEKSPRCVTTAAAAKIARHIPPFVARVGVFVDAPADFVRRAIRECHLDLLQFHGEESPDYCLQFGLMSVKAIRVRDPESLRVLSQYQTDAWLLDAYSAATPGGTGETFNWDLAVEAGRFGRPLFLAGGLTPENVAKAIRKVQPYGVDVSSGVESAPGIKDPDKIRRFIAAARLAA